MESKIAKFGKYTVTYFCKEELKVLKEEIFQNEIYSVNLDFSKTQEPEIFDVGAHIGLTTIYFKSKYPKSKITCFEPNPNVLPLLEENIFYNCLKNVKVYNVALGKNEGVNKLYIDKTQNGAFSTASFRKNAWNGKQKSVPITVQTQPLSKYICKRVDLVKMDVEGSEYEIIKELDSQGSFKYIQNMIVEYHPKKRQNVNNLIDILQRNDFDLEYFKDGKALKRLLDDLILIVAKKRV